LGWKQHLERGDRARAEHRFQEAEQEFRAAQAELRDASDARMPSTLNRTAVALAGLFHYAEAEAAVREALALAAARDPTDLAVAPILQTMGSIYRRLGRHADAEHCLRRLVTIEERQLGALHVNVAEALHSLGIILQEEEKYSEAERAVRQALRIWEHVAPEKQADFAGGLSTLADIEMRRHRFKASASDHARALAMFEGLESPELVIVLARFAFCSLAMKNYEQAESLSRRALTIAATSRERLVPNAAQAELALAVAVAGQNRLKEADEHFAQALDIAGRVAGFQSVSYARILESYAAYLITAKRPKEAAEIQSRVSAILAPSKNVIGVTGLRSGDDRSK
jgi:tetratricopeptide (TPR) repeat protein